jgi:ankyrin repeat protein
MKEFCGLLWRTIFKGRVDSAKVLLAHGADVKARYREGSDYISPLTYARRHKKPQIAKLIEEAGGKEASERATPQNAPRAQQEARLLWEAVVSKDMQKLRGLVSNGVNVNVGNLIGETALLNAVRHGNLETIIFLLDHGADIELNNPLIWAVQANRIDVVKLLITRGARVNAANTSGRRALDEAISLKRPDIAELLLKNGANPNLTDNLFGEPVLTSVVGFLDMSGAKLLVRYKADVNARGERDMTPLMKAAAIGSAEMAEFLLASGARVNDADQSGWTALLYAVNGNRQAAMETLLKHGASITAKDNIGRSPLSIAIEKGDIENVKRLVKGGIDKNAMNVHGAKYLQETIRRQDFAMMNFFLEQGADPNARISPEGVTVLMNAIAAGNTEAAKRLIATNARINDR